MKPVLDVARSTKVLKFRFLCVVTSRHIAEMIESVEKHVLNNFQAPVLHLLPSKLLKLFESNIVYVCGLTVIVIAAAIRCKHNIFK